tara:strand:- start:644 stop:2671 length:2028 start_codon:yes stop_codon:yes gene_type:complete
MEKKKIIISAIAALAGGGILLALYKKKKDKEKEKDSSGNTVTVTPPSGGVDDTIGGGGVSEEEILGGGGSGGGGGGGGGANMTLCRGLDEEGEAVNELVPMGEACPASAPFSDDVEWEEYLYDAFHCYDVDEDGEVVEEDKEFTEVCGEDFPEYPFETQNDALLYASDPSFYEGCTDETAFNFDENAILDDGSCEIVVEGCMIEEADNYDPEANTENNDLCEFPPEAVVGCTDESANNFDEAADTDDGSCLFDVTCFSITEDYSVEPVALELAQGETCYLDVEPIFLDYFRTGYFNASEDAQQYIEGFFGEANDILDDNSEPDPIELTTCYYISPETGEVISGEFSFLNNEDCETQSIIPEATLFNTLEDAQEYFDEISALDTQDCYSYDADGVFILSDLPLIDGDTGDIISCESLGYFSISIGGELNAQNAYELEFVDTLEDFEEADEEEQEEEPTEDFEGTEDTSAIVDQSVCGTLDLCTEGGTVPSGLQLELNAGGMTANEVNSALGFVCYDPDTCQNIFYTPPQVGEIQTATDAQNLILSCFPSPTGASEEAISYLPSIAAQNYPLLWSDFNQLIGFNCLNENAEVVNTYQYEEPAEDFEEEIVDDSDTYTEPIVDFEPQDDTENDTQEEPVEDFSNFVNSLNNSPMGGCTDPMALNFDEGAEFDDDSCDY